MQSLKSYWNDFECVFNEILHTMGVEQVTDMNVKILIDVIDIYVCCGVKHKL